MRLPDIDRFRLSKLRTWSDRTLARPPLNGAGTMPQRFAFFIRAGGIVEDPMAEYKETHVTKSETGGSGATPWLAFLVGALLIAVVAIFLMNAHGRVTGPA